MEQRKPGCGLTFVMVIIPLLVVLSYGITMLSATGMYNSLKNGDTAVTATVEQNKGPSFWIKEADTVSVRYEVDGEEYHADILTESGTTDAGDTMTVYYNPNWKSSAVTDTHYEFLIKTYRTGLIVSAIVFGALLLLRIIIGAVAMKRADNSGGSTHNVTNNYNRLTGEEQDFWSLFFQSLEYKKQGRLASALEARESGLRMMEDRHDYYCMAQHNLLVLQCYHCCDGVSAYKSGKESLRYKDEFRELSDRMSPMLKYSSYDESLVYTAMLAKSREEAGELLREAVNRNAYRTAVQHAKEMLAMMEKFPKWLDYQRNYAANFYSRHSAQYDKGDYSPACAILQVILSREGEKGYDMTEEQYVDILDDYLMNSLRYFTLRSGVLIQNGGSPDRELLFIVKKPLKVLIDFLPDCEKKRFKDIFRSVMKEYEHYDVPFKQYLPEYEKARKLLKM